MVFALHMSEIAEIGGIHVFSPFTLMYVVECIAIFSAITWFKYTAFKRKQLQIYFQHDQNLRLKPNPL